ncbi:MAG: protein-L-isoaspartate O-methyltransferase [Gammaproteobacteria bacterium]|nr:protein-L-isoaspartate O-methyltransferase [Gammaproteobacteria bacterium]
MNYQKARFNMVEQQIRPWDVLDQRVLDAVEGLPREAFVPPSFGMLAYADAALPLADGQLMMPPKVAARLTQELLLEATDRVLEVGTGSGYLTALLGRLCRHVYSMEISPGLSKAAAQVLEKQGIANVTLGVGNGLAGWDEHAPFDAIVVTGSLTEVPDTLLRSLTLGGRLVAVVGTPPVMEAMRYQRETDDYWSTTSLFDTELPPVSGLAEPEPFDF